jgi:peptidoglycan hydrolase-like protein with peptidoglycan-binding domain
MELAAYIYDAWAYEQANHESSDINFHAFSETYTAEDQINASNTSLNKINWQAYLLSAIAVASCSSLGGNLELAAANQLLETAVNVAPWCENLYLCNTNYVLDAQILLANRGFAVGDLDGVYGRYTKQAVMDFQATQPNLVVDGVPGARTLALLRNSAVTSSQSTTQTSMSDRTVIQPRPPIIVRANELPSTTPTISQTSNQTINIQRSAGDEVGNLQILLQRRGFYQGEIDGIQGQNVTNAVLKAQQAYGLYADGFAGPMTIRALLAGGNNLPLSQPALNRSPTPQDVLETQLLLKERGFYDEGLNGLYNIRTRASILKAQIAYGQPATGDLSLDLLTALKGQNIIQNTQSNIQAVPTAQQNPNNQDIRSSPNNNMQPPLNNSQAPSSGQNSPIQPQKSSTL